MTSYVPAAITPLQVVTLSVAVLGAVLGIINTWHGLDQSRLKLKLTPKHVIAVGINDKLEFCIEVTNLSAFPVTICDVGVLYKGTNDRGTMIQPVLLDRGPWPRRLEARSSVTVYGDRLVPTKYRIKCAYATTECGNTVEGTSPALKQMANELWT
jgi:hypothetical protein